MLTVVTLHADDDLAACRRRTRPRPFEKAPQHLLQVRHRPGHPPLLLGGDQRRRRRPGLLLRGVLHHRLRLVLLDVKVRLGVRALGDDERAVVLPRGLLLGLKEPKEHVLLAGEPADPRLPGPVEARGDLMARNPSVLGLSPAERAALPPQLRHQVGELHRADLRHLVVVELFPAQVEPGAGALAPERGNVVRPRGLLLLVVPPEVHLLLLHPDRGLPPAGQPVLAHAAKARGERVPSGGRPLLSLAGRRPLARGARGLLLRARGALGDPLADPADLGRVARGGRLL
mmetsp:Transcript_6796/g.24499  ORF Transcript_6796/g.24499 Transcript_6796/m.24499 type:complete len:287 (+) Transcript_6796:113-973(+)